jgi:hypothetical protein
LSKTSAIFLALLEPIQPNLIHDHLITPGYRSPRSSCRDHELLFPAAGRYQSLRGGCEEAAPSFVQGVNIAKQN